MDTTKQPSQQRISRMGFVLVPRILALLCVLGAGGVLISGFARGAVTGLTSGPVLLALICVVAAFGIGIQPLGYTTVVRDDGDALLVGWCQARILISEISEVRFAAPRGYWRRSARHCALGRTWRRRVQLRPARPAFRGAEADRGAAISGCVA